MPHMSYRTIVLVKQVPDTAHVTGDVMRPDGTVNRGKLPAVFNPDDRVALELALQLRDEFGGRVTAITMGPPSAADVLRECLYMGADDVCLITDRKFAGADTLATSYVLAAAIRTLGTYDFVFGGRQAIDGDTAQVGPQTAEKLGIPQVTYAEEVPELRDGRIVVKRRIDGGYEIVVSTIPVLITVIKEAATPRPFRATRLMTYKNARSLPELQKAAKADPPRDVDDLVREYAERDCFIKTLSAADIDVDPARCGIGGSPTKVHKVKSVILAAQEHEKIMATQEGISDLLDELVEARVIG